ncbi:hypothetical protein BASA81_006584 [Batrachochytrium salamandrivorans]|nr:hypothetical protein BASA81_006584 [Batrachochytrium salamandrivorans]
MDNASPPPGVGGEGGRGPGPPDGRPSPGSSHRVVKLNLARVLRDLTKLKVLCDMVKGGHHIVVHAFQFIKLFLLDEYETQPRSKSTAKNALNARLYPHYERVAYRKMRWYRYINSQRSDAKMVNDFGAKLGTKEQVVLAYGDWGQGSHHMQHHAPTRRVGMRRLFEKAGYLVVLVDEYLTSRTCYACDGRCAKFKMVPQPRPWMRETRPQVLRHGLLRCNDCSRHWNRDRNGSLNIMRCGQAARDDLDRPPCMDRIKIGETKRAAEAIRQAGSEATREGSLSDLTTQRTSL